MKVKLLALALAAALLLPCGYARAANDAPPPDSAAAMLLFHAPSGTVLAQHNADDRRLIASTTKLMTALVALEQGAPEDTVTVEGQWLAVEGSSMYLRAGERYTLRELLTGLLLVSGNDAANAIACHIAGDADAFAVLMNEKAAALQMHNSHFCNPHGLDDARHYSSARDLALLMAAVMENETLRELVGTRSSIIKGNNYVNHNKLLWRSDGCVGGKTGYTRAAGRCLVSVCRRGELELICVTLSDRDDWRDHGALYDWACGRYECVRYGAGEPLAEVPVIGGDRPLAPAAPAEDVFFCLPKGVEIRPVCALPRFVFPPLRRGEPAGGVVFYIHGEPAARRELFWTQDTSRAAGVRSIRI